MQSPYLNTMYLVRLKKISNNPNKLRTETVTGIALRAPQEFRSFEVWSKPLESNRDFRWIRTSTVQILDWLIPNKICTLTTLHSEYRLEILKMIEIDGFDQDFLDSTDSLGAMTEEEFARLKQELGKI